MPAALLLLTFRQFSPNCMNDLTSSVENREFRPLLLETSFLNSKRPLAEANVLDAFLVVCSVRLSMNDKHTVCRPAWYHDRFSEAAARHLASRP